MNDIVNEWISKAEEDYWVTIQLARLRKRPVHNAVCFHAQQCIEKYLKAILQKQGARIRKIHVLQQLLDDCLPWYPLLEAMREDLLKLSEYAVEFRYPGESANRDEAESAVEIMVRCRAEIRQALGLVNGRRKGKRA